MLKKLINQFGKFAIVGGINTGVDFTVLNILMWLTGIASGRYIIVLNAISFSVAVVNSYFWNKFWTFKAEKTSPTKQLTGEFFQFIAVSLIGIAINSITVYVMTTFVSSPVEIHDQLWANVSKVFATGLSLVWNFIGYKLFVFRR